MTHFIPPGKHKAVEVFSQHLDGSLRVRQRCEVPHSPDVRPEATLYVFVDASETELKCKQIAYEKAQELVA